MLRVFPNKIRSLAKENKRANYFCLWKPLSVLTTVCLIIFSYVPCHDGIWRQRTEGASLYSLVFCRPGTHCSLVRRIWGVIWFHNNLTKSQYLQIFHIYSLSVRSLGLSLLFVLLLGLFYQRRPSALSPTLVQFQSNFVNAETLTAFPTRSM